MLLTVYCCPFICCVQRKWYRNFLMRGFHMCVLMVAGPGVRDTQVGECQTSEIREQPSQDGPSSCHLLWLLVSEWLVIRLYLSEFLWAVPSALNQVIAQLFLL